MSSGESTEKGFVLLIDDDPLLIKTIKHVLEREGFDVTAASNGFEGIEKAKSGFFHLVLCDVRMPGLDGLMTIAHIQKFQKSAGVDHSGFVMISAYDTPETKATASQLGVTDFLLKPFDLNKFLETIHHNIDPLLKKTPLSEVEKLNKHLERLLYLQKQTKHEG